MGIARIYLRPGEAAPVGVQVQIGPRGGRYYNNQDIDTDRLGDTGGPDNYNLPWSVTPLRLPETHSMGVRPWQSGQVTLGERLGANPSKEPGLYFHVVGPNWSLGDDLLSSEEYEMRYVEKPEEWKWPDEREGFDGDIVSLFDNLKEAVAYAKDVNRPIVAVRVPENLHEYGLSGGTNDEGFSYISRRVPAEWIRPVQLTGEDGDVGFLWHSGYNTWTGEVEKAIAKGQRSTPPGYMELTQPRAFACGNCHHFDGPALCTAFDAVVAEDHGCCNAFEPKQELLAHSKEGTPSTGNAASEVVTSASGKGEKTRTAVTISKEWVPYQGPRGGQGWQSTETYEVRYQGEKPSEAEEVQPAIRQVEAKRPDAVVVAPDAENFEVGQTSGVKPLDANILSVEQKREELGDWHRAPTSEIAQHMVGFDVGAEVEAIEREAGDTLRAAVLGSQRFHPFSLWRRTRHMNEVSEHLNHSYAGWVSDSASARTAPLWAWAAARYQNENVPSLLFGQVYREIHGAGLRGDDYAEQVKQRALLTSEKGADFEKHARIAQEFARRHDPSYDPQTDTVVVYRGVMLSTEQMRAIQDAKGKPILTRHRTLESWSVDPKVALDFGNTVLSARIPVASIVSSWCVNSHLEPSEAEYVVAMPRGEYAYGHDEIFTDRNVSDRKLLTRSDQVLGAWRALHVKKWKEESERVAAQQAVVVNAIRQRVNPTTTPKLAQFFDMLDSGESPLLHDAFYLASDELSNLDLSLEEYTTLSSYVIARSQ